MANVEGYGQWAPPGINVLPAEEGFGAPFVRWTRRRIFHLTQIVVTQAVHRWADAFEANPHDAKTLADVRAWHARHDSSAMTSLEEGAVKVAAPASRAPSDASPVPADWFAPKAKSERGVVFYVHGGSFVVERSPRITALVGRFAAAAGAKVYAPNYRLAPEHPCPAAVDDIVAAWRWHRRLWPDERVVALAESSGGAILLAALLKIRDSDEPLPCGIVLLSPWVDLALQSWSVVAASVAHSTPYTMELLALMVHLYLQGGIPAADPAASPVYGDFTGFPPMLIHACKDDILYDDAIRLAERVRAANGHLTVRAWTDETHVWERMHSAKARHSIEFAAKFIRQRLDAAKAM